MTNTRGNGLRAGLAASVLVAASTWAAPAGAAPALAARGDVMIEQVTAAPAGGAWQIAQARPAAAYHASVTQISVAPDHLVPQVTVRHADALASFQVHPAGTATAFAFADIGQLSPVLGSRGGAVELAFLGFGLDLGSYRMTGTGSFATRDASNNVTQRRWSGEANLQAAVQAGSDNEALLDQAGIQNAALVIQNGNANLVDVTQHSAFTQAIVIQQGNANRASLFQQSPDAMAFVSQAGTGNIAIVRQ